jgi:hypothetical protein
MFFQDSKLAAMETFLLDPPKTRPWHVSQLQKVGHIGMTEVKALRPRQSEHRDFKMQHGSARQGKQKLNMTINSACAPHISRQSNGHNRSQLFPPCWNKKKHVNFAANCFDWR